MASARIFPVVRLPLLAGALALALVSCGLPSARAQEEDDKIPKPEDVILSTKDGVQLFCTYYAGLKKKESVPVILLHDYKGNRHDWDSLALELQKQHGFAVITVDLRGHGDSTTRKDQDKKLEAEDMRPSEYPLMVEYDMEKVKSFLVQKNNEAALNIDKLSICGAGMGALVGTLYTVKDWNWPPLSTGKQGQDVKALVLISPDFAFKGLAMQAVAAMPDVRSKVSVYIAVGSTDPKAWKDADRVYKLFKPHHRVIKDKEEDRDLFFDDSMKTKLQGTKLLGEQALGLSGRIAEFLEFRAAKQPYPWKDRRTSF